MPSRTTDKGPSSAADHEDFSPQQLLQHLERLPRTGRYLVAFSGGLDSTVLLHSLHQIESRLGAALEAIHIDHGLNLRSSLWSQHCAAFCAERGIPLTLHRLEIDCPRGESLEACAREARYAAMEKHLNEDDALLTAHHRDDQAETFLLHLLRGSGPRGLSAMPPARRFGPGWLLRPLLGFNRATLESYAREHGLVWVDDESNQETRFDRNYLRHRVIPELQGRWPSATTTLARAARLCAEAEAAVSERALVDLSTVKDGETLSGVRLSSLSKVRQRAVLRLWLAERGLPVPDHSRLGELRRQIESARDDRQVHIHWRGAEVHRYRGQVYAHEPLPPHDETTEIHWVEEGELTLPDGLGRLKIEPFTSGERLTVRFRCGGETLMDGRMHRPVKKILQEAGVPPWLRARVPLVYRQGELIAVGDYRCLSGYRVYWHRDEGWPLGKA